MACGSKRFDFDEHCVVIAVETDLHYSLGIARCLALVPKLLPAAAPQVRLPPFQRELEGFFVHIRNRQHLAGVRILDDGWNQTVGAELCIFEDLVHRTTTPRSRRNDLVSAIVSSRK